MGDVVRRKATAIITDARFCHSGVDAWVKVYLQAFDISLYTMLRRTKG
jgi:hypothetical protein